MKQFALGLWFISTSLSFAFTPTKSEWTILIYGAGDEIQVKEPTGMTLKRFERAQSLSASGPVRVVAIHDEVDDNNGKGDGFRYVLEHVKHPSQHSSPDTKPLPAKLISEQLNDEFSYKDIDSGDPRTLKAFLKWGVKNYPANHYILVLAGHSWGQQGLMQDFFVNGKSLEVSTLIKNYELRRVMEEVYREERPNIPAGKFDLLLIDACTSGQLDVLLEWDKVFEYVAASSVETPFNSIPYDAFLENFIRAVSKATSDSAHSILEDDFLKPLVSNYVKSHVRGGSLTFAEKQIDAVEFFVARMGKIQGLGNSLKNLVSTLPASVRSAWLAGQMKEWEDIRDSDYNVDLLTFANRVETLANDKNWPQVKLAARKLASTFGYPTNDPTTEPVLIPFSQFPKSKGAWIHLEVDEVAPLREIAACLALKTFGMLNYDQPELIPTFTNTEGKSLSAHELPCNDLGEHAIEESSQPEKPLFSQKLELKSIFGHNIRWQHHQMAFLKEFPKRDGTRELGRRILSVWVPRSRHKHRSVRLGIMAAGKAVVQFIGSADATVGKIKLQIPSYFIADGFGPNSLYVTQGKSSGTQFKTGIGIFLDRELHEDDWPYVGGRMPIERTVFNDRTLEVYLGYLEATGTLHKQAIKGQSFYRAHRIEMTGWPAFILPDIGR